MADFHNMVAVDGIWIDMNEVGSFDFRVFSRDLCSLTYRSSDNRSPISVTVMELVKSVPTLLLKVALLLVKAKLTVA
jgi:hypothetical protein